MKSITHYNSFSIVIIDSTMTINSDSSVKKEIPCISEGKKVKNCAYKPLETTPSEFKQECLHCGKIRTVMRRRRG